MDEKSLVVGSQSVLEVVKSSIAPGATDDQLRYFLAVAERTGLDPITGQVKFIIVKKKMPNGMYADAVQPYVGIDGLRSIAERSGKYQGQTGPWWCGQDGKWRDVWLENVPPAAAKVGVLRSDFREPIIGVATWEQYAQRDRDGKPSRSWATHGPLMLAKCAEALALRRAFPMVLSGLYSEEEIASVKQFSEQDSIIDVAPQAPEQVKVEPDTKNNKLRAAVHWRKIRPLIMARGLTDEDVRDFMINRFGKASSADLTDEEWDAITRWLENGDSEER